MSAFVDRRRGTGDWITKAFADAAGIRTVTELLAFILCVALLALLVWMVLNPIDFTHAVTDLVVRIVGAFSW